MDATGQLTVYTWVQMPANVPYKTNTQFDPGKYVNIVLCKDPDSCVLYTKYINANMTINKCV